MKYLVKYAHKIVECETLIDAFSLLGFSIKIIKEPETINSGSVSWVELGSIEIKDAGKCPTYRYGPKDFTIREIMVDVVKSKCEVYRNTSR